MKSVVVAVDAMGGDNAPAVEVESAVAAARKWGMPIILVGDSTQVACELDKHDTENLQIRIHHASEVVGMKDSAADAVRRKKDSSIRVAYDLVKAGEAHAVVSAGNSGATMAAGMFIAKRVTGIERPALSTILPTVTGQSLILDVGGNVDCKPIHLEHFAVMGDVYARHIMGKKSPRIGLLSNGAEEKKGNDLTRETHRHLLRHNFNYIGYVEGRDIYSGNVDVVVCDGFVGNVVIKVSEGLADSIGQMLRAELKSRLLAKLGYLLARPAFRAFKKKVDYAEYGGAPLLGIKGTSIICHGGSNVKAIMNAIGQAANSVDKNMIGELVKQLDNFRAVTDVSIKAVDVA
ncbi:MAG: phosphate--acyl-ACP acyltransferase [Desulfobacteraceae bacterium 4572_35.1]|nr:MAG: phosphate--acyl-ACP acyltransferase [Desulfobacteraceae bacterium 4572_35.1]